MSAHTPGPWKAEQALGGHDHPLHIFAHGEVIGQAYADGADTADANARLIAAAPDLLDAVRKLVLCCEMDGLDANNYAAVGAARTAIAKATGAESKEAA